MCRVDHEVAWFQIGDVGSERCQLRLRRLPRDQIGSLEDVLGSENGQFRIDQDRTSPDATLHQVHAGKCAGVIGALGKRGLGPRTALQAQLIGNRVLLQNVGDALHFSGREGKERDAIAGLDQVPASATATGMLPLNVSDGRVGM